MVKVMKGAIFLPKLSKDILVLARKVAIAKNN